MVAARMGSVAFFEPEISIVPDNRALPRIFKASITTATLIAMSTDLYSTHDQAVPGREPGCK